MVDRTMLLERARKRPFFVAKAKVFLSTIFLSFVLDEHYLLHILPNEP